MSSTLDELTPVEQLFASFAAAELPKNAHSNALASSRVVLAGTGYLVSLYVTNTNAAAQYIHVHDARELPSNGAVPEVVLTALASSDKFLAYALPGRFFRHGITICNSSTAATTTLGSADIFVDAQFIPVVSA